MAYQSETNSDETAEGVAWCQQLLERLDFVEWDRFTTGEWFGGQRYFSVYGWIGRDDDYKDFALLIMWPESEIVYPLTSSDKWSEEIHRQLWGEDDGHNDCRRVEETFDIPNAIELDGANHGG